MALFRITKHAEARMQQRGRRPQDIEFVVRHGTETPAGILLTASDAAAIEREARRMIEMAGKLRNILVPCEGGAIKTVFRASRDQQRRLL